MVEFARMLRKRIQQWEATANDIRTVGVALGVQESLNFLHA